MPVNLNLAPGIPVAGVEIASVAAGIKADGSVDLVLFKLADDSNTAAVFTQNTFCAAPVTVCKKHLPGPVRALLINSGNANAGTGQPGIDMAVGYCAAVAAALEISREQVLPFSTGVIGQLLPDEKMLDGIWHASEKLSTSPEHWDAAARGIMTTDTAPKLTSRRIEVDGQTVTITGMSKGAGMIQPNMATMLAYVFTDASIATEHLDTALRAAVDVSFNAITVDSDTSTNDSCVLSATGCGLSLSPSHAAWPAFMQALIEEHRDLAQAIVRDAEGATKFISVNVSGGRNSTECKSVAYAIANSPLVKTAMFASDANVGRLLMAIGKADIPDLDSSGVTVSLGDVRAFEQGGVANGYSEERGAAVMAKDEISVLVDLGRGEASAAVYTSDLSHDYVSINADYRS